MGGRGARAGGRGGGGGRGLGGGQGQGGGRGGGGSQGQCGGQRRRDGSGRGVGLAQGVPAPVTQPAPDAGAPKAAARSRTVAVVAHPEECTLCEACVDVCSRNAITLRETAEVDAALCNGCGDCVTECPNGVLELAEV